jgi:hypothetical protein
MNVTGRPFPRCVPGKAEAIVLRKLIFLAVFAGAFTPRVFGHSQDQHSLGDVARQARKDKEKNTTPPKNVVTDETLPSGNELGGLGINDLSDVTASSSGNPVDAGLAGLKRAEFALNKLAPMDRATLARAVLEGNNTNFPNRANWEIKLYSAKQTYVAHSRELIQEMRDLLAYAQSLKASGGDKVGPDDARVQALLSRTQEIVQDAVRTETAFRAIAMEGQDLAKQGASR